MDLPDVDNTEKFNCISLCTGYAGIELGLERVIPNFRTILYVEVEAFACTNLVAKIEEGKLDAAPIWTDIKTFNGRPFRDRIHIITGGYPCQPFSVAGKRQGTDDPRHLWPHIERIIETVRPLWFFGENVSGHLAIGFPEVYRSLRNLGYTVEAGLFTAAECGAPHRRERLFILAHTRNNKYGKTSNIVKPSNKFESSNKKLANTCTQGLQGQKRSGICEKTQENRDCNFTRCLWPACPGQPQYEWEEPRVVANTTTRRTRNKNREIERQKRTQKIQQGNGATCSIQCNATSQGQAQSRLGRTAYGTTYSLDVAKGIRGGYYTKPGGEIGHNLVMEAKQRVDRLRLLGNGVVPQCAEKAFRYLIEKF